MRRFFVVFYALVVAVSSLFPLAAQQAPAGRNTIPDEGRAPWRTEFISYDIRKEADAGMMAGSKYFAGLSFELERAADTYTTYAATVEIPALWLDRDMWVRDTGRTGRYVLVVNGREVGINSDSYGTNDYLVTPWLREGENTILLVFSDGVPGGDMERFEVEGARGRAIENLYIWSQPRVHIFDYTVGGHYDEEFRDMVIDLEVIVENGFNMPERVTVGFDVFDPNRELKEYTFEETTVPGHGRDTVRFMSKITGADKFRYSASGPALYDVVLLLKHGGRNTEYIPLKLGFGETGFDGENILRNGAPIAINAAEGDFPVMAGALEKLRALKKRGVNTIRVARPQQKWFYDMCVREGLYIIDRAAVDCDPRGGDRRLGGTVANDPSHLAYFLDRQQAMYYRGRNYPNIIGWSIGSESGNGYNMYKSYRLLKSLDRTRPVIYEYAEGEWNSDMEIAETRTAE